MTVKGAEFWYPRQGNGTGGFPLFTFEPGPDHASYIIEGQHRLTGTVRPSGAKNAVLPIMAAILLTKEPCTIVNVPALRDVSMMMGILTALGARIETGTTAGQPSLTIQVKDIASTAGPPDLMGEIRSSIFIMGPLLAREGECMVSYPGGCAIGPRPIDLHLKGLRLLGASISEEYGRITARTTGLRGADIHLDFPSVGATENLMMAAVLAEGCTVIHNAAKEPEIVDLQDFLNLIGANIRGAGTDTIRIVGRSSLGGGAHAVIPDRIEAGTLAIAACATGGDVRLAGTIPDHLLALTAKLGEMGAEITEEDDGTLRVRANRRLRATDIKTLPYPGFATDLQPQIMALMSLADGTSILTETVFEKRFNHVEELRRMGADIRVDGRTAVIKGPARLTGTTVQASDLRAGAGLVIAALAAEGTSVVRGVEHIERGYEGLEVKLGSLGAVIKKKDPYPKVRASTG